MRLVRIPLRLFATPELYLELIITFFAACVAELMYTNVYNFSLTSQTIITGLATCLKDVFIEVPLAIKEGTTAIMRCDYDLEEEALYTVKWYKGRQEFFRYVPKELPHTRVFPIATINVDVSLL